MTNENNRSFRIVVKFGDGWDVSVPGENTHDDTVKSQQTCLQNLLSTFEGLRIGKLFTSLGPKQIFALVDRAGKSDPAYRPPDFLAYYSVDCPLYIDHADLLQKIRQYGEVESAYLESGPLLPPSIKIVSPSAILRQGYLEPAPMGIDARYAWTFCPPSIQGHVKFVDVEQGWVEDHESFQIKRFLNSGLNHPAFRDHGAAALGTILMNNKAEGITGIAPGADASVMSQWREGGFFNTADAIMAAAHELQAGDILLVEAQIFDSPFHPGMWPVEIQDAVFEAIRLATALGIIVIEPAANGQGSFCDGNNLDAFINVTGHRIMDRTHPDFKDAGSILVAASSSDSPHKRLSYSNFGNRVDCFAWGDRVFTAGAYPASSGLDRTTYTWTFGGTSSAAAIVAGAALLIQGIVRLRYKIVLSPRQLREFISNEALTTASARGRIVDKIGGMPDLRKIILHLEKCFG